MRLGLGFKAITLAATIAGLSWSTAFAADYCSGASYCSLPTTSSTNWSSNTWETAGFVGLQWNFGTSSPELLVGIRRTQTNIDDDVAGGKLDFAFKLDTKTFTLPTVRMMGLYGNREIQGEFGAGIQLHDFKPVIGAGAQVPFINLGANYVFGKGLDIYAGFNTLRKPEPAKSGSTPGEMTCPAGYDLVEASTYTSIASFISGGKTCILPPS